MKKQNQIFFTISLFIAVIAIIGTTGAVAGDRPFGQSPANAPKAVVVENEYSFDDVLEGEMVTHAYEIKNQGGVPLEILNIRTSCGCTTAKQPKAIEPGTSGQIEVQGDTRGYGGHVFDKTITVSTNDPLSPQLRLKLRGPVGLFARIEPTRIMLRGGAGASITARSTIAPNPKHPFRITEVIPDKRLADKINVQLDEHEGKYLLTVDNRQTTPGQYRGQVTLKTDSTLRPKLFVYVFGDIKA